MAIIEYLTAALVIITAVYSYLTYKMAKAAEASVQAVRDQSEALFRPYISVSPYVRPHTTILYLKVENTGRSTAQDLTLSIDRDFFQFGEKSRADHNLRTKPAFAQGINSMPPAAKLIFGLAQGPVIYSAGPDSEVVPQQFMITAEYSFAGKRVSEETRVDLRPYLGTEGEREALVDELERIRKVLEK